jgi:hypothetical protein
MRALPVIVLASAGAVFFAWGFIATMGDIPGCGGVPHEDGVDSWAAIGVFAALLLGVFGGTILARRLRGWFAVAATVSLVLLVVLGAQAGYAIGMERAGCAWDEGPALTLVLFATPAALFGYAIGWVLRRAEV